VELYLLLVCEFVIVLRELSPLLVCECVNVLRELSPLLVCECDIVLRSGEFGGESPTKPPGRCSLLVRAAGGASVSDISWTCGCRGFRCW
jgi:hypothetical protein